MASQRSLTPVRQSERLRAKTPATPGGTRQLKNRDNSDDLGLPSVQGAGSVSYGSPGQADLPQMLVHSTRKTLAETIDAELQDNGDNMVNGFQDDDSAPPSTRGNTRSKSVESQKTQGSNASTSGPNRGNKSSRRGQPANNLPSVQEERDQDSSITTGGAGATSTQGDPTTSFVQERNGHRSGRPPQTTEVVPLPDTADDRRYQLPHQLRIKPLYLTVLVLFILLTLLSYNYDTVTAKLARLTHSVPVLSHLSSKFCYDYNPFLRVNDTKTAKALLEEQGLAIEIYHEVLKQQDQASQTMVKMGESHKALSETTEVLKKHSHQVNKLFGDVRQSALHLHQRVHAVEDRVFTVESIVRQLNLSQISPAEWFWDELNHFAPLNGAVSNPELTSKTFNYSEAWFKRVLRGAFRYRLPRKPVEALRRFEDQGDCWCGETTQDGRNWTQFSVVIPDAIYPTSIVIDHVPKRAVRRGSRSMPKDIELWGRILSERGREIVRDVEPYNSLNPRNNPYIGEDESLGPEWVRIRNMTYNSDDRVHVQHFTIPMWPRFETTGVKEFVVRATSNYGAKDHTCFYWVVMRGPFVREPVEEN